jgi:hypothetical protein
VKFGIEIRFASSVIAALYKVSGVLSPSVAAETISPSLEQDCLERDAHRISAEFVR